jgi:hypothetical protein
MVLPLLIGLALWIAISIPVALYFVRAMALDEGTPEAAEIHERLGHVDSSATLDSPAPPPARRHAAPQGLQPRHRTGAAA